MTYAERRRKNGADFYGTWRDGRQITGDIIAGVTHWWPQPAALRIPRS